jgi:hypothetical protein
MVQVTGRQVMVVLGVLLFVVSLWRFVLVSLAVLAFVLVVGTGFFLVHRMTVLGNALDDQTAQLEAARREIAELRRRLETEGLRPSEVDVREPVAAAQYAGGRMSTAGQRPEWADVTWPGRSRYA